MKRLLALLLLFSSAHIFAAPSTTTELDVHEHYYKHNPCEEHKKLGCTQCSDVSRLRKVQKKICTIDSKIDALNFTVCDKVVSAIDTINNNTNSVLDAAAASLSFTILDTIENNVNNAVSSLGFTVCEKVEGAVSSLGYTIADAAQSICSKIDLLDNDIKFTIAENIDNSQASLGFTVCEKTEAAVSSLGFTICDKIEQATLCNPTPITASTTIAVSGHYCLANDIVGTVVITGNNVTFDLNGYTITGGSNGMCIFGNEAFVHGGTVRGADVGVNITGDKNRLENLDLIANTIGVELTNANANIIENVRALCNISAGFSLVSSNRNCVINCKAVDNGNDGNAFGFVSVDGMCNLFDGCIAENTHTTECGPSFAAGFLLTGNETKSKIKHCQASNTTGTDAFGIRLEGVLFVPEGPIALTKLDGFDHTSTGPFGENTPISSVDWLICGESKYLAISGIDGDDDANVRVLKFDAATGTLSALTSATFDNNSLQTQNAIRSVAWQVCGDSKYLAIGGVENSDDGAEVRIFTFDAATETLTAIASATFDHGDFSGNLIFAGILSVAWLPNSKLLAIGGNNGTGGAEVRILEFDDVAGTLSQAGSAEFNHGQTIITLAWLASGTNNYLAIGGVAGTGGFEVRVLKFNDSANTLTEVGAFNRPGGDAKSVAWLDCGTSKYLAIGGRKDPENSVGPDVEILQFDVATETLTALPTATFQHAQISATFDRFGVCGLDWLSCGSTKYLALKGLNNTNDIDTRILVFDPETNLLSEVLSLDVISANIGGAKSVCAVKWQTCGVSVYLALGGAADSNSDEVQVYEFTGCSFDGPSCNIIKKNHVTNNAGTGIQDDSLNDSTNQIYANFSCKNGTNFNIGSQFPISSPRSKGVGETENIDCALDGTDDFEEIKFTICDKTNSILETIMGPGGMMADLRCVKFTICDKAEQTVASLAFTICDKTNSILETIMGPGGMMTNLNSVKFTVCDKVESLSDVLCSKLEALDIMITASIMNPCAPTPITGTTNIMDSGSYCLANSSGAAITISASNVTIDLNGHTAASIAVGSGSNICIKNGKVTGAISGTATNVTIKDVLGGSVSLASASNIAIIDSQFNGGLSLVGASSSLINSSFNSLNLGTDNTAVDCHILNTLSGNGDSFIKNCFASSYSFGSTNNYFEECSGGSFDIDDNSTLRECNGESFIVGSHCSVVNCTANGGTNGFSMQMFANCSTFKGCCATKCTNSGFRFDNDNNIIENCTASDNNLFGFRDLSGNNNQFYANIACNNGTNYLGISSAEITSPNNARGVKNVDCSNTDPDAVEETKATICDKVLNAQKTICDKIGALDGSLVGILISQLEGVVSTFTSISSITDHVLMTLTQLDELAMDISDNFMSINEMIEKVKFTVCDKAEQTVASLGFTICDKAESILDAIMGPGGMMTDLSSVKFTICDKIEQATLCNPTPVTAPTTIDTSGSYCLANDIFGSVVIDASNVQLNLNGYTVFAGSSDAISISSGFTAHRNNVILNGVVQTNPDETTNGINIADSVNTMIMDVKIDCGEPFGQGQGQTQSGIVGDSAMACNMQRVTIINCNDSAIRLNNCSDCCLEEVKALKCSNVSSLGIISFDGNAGKNNTCRNCHVKEASAITVSGLAGFFTENNNTTYRHCITQDVTDTTEVGAFLNGFRSTSTGTSYAQCIAQDIIANLNIEAAGFEFTNAHCSIARECHALNIESPLAARGFGVKQLVNAPNSYLFVDCIAECINSFEGAGFRYNADTALDTLEFKRCQSINISNQQTFGFFIENPLKLIIVDSIAHAINGVLTARGFYILGQNPNACAAIVNCITKGFPTGSPVTGFDTSAFGGIATIKDCCAFGNGSGTGFDGASTHTFLANAACDFGTNYSITSPPSAPVSSPANARGVYNVDCADTTPDLIGSLVDCLCP